MVQRGIISPAKKVEFISYRMSYRKLGGFWCDIILLNVHAPTEDKSDDTNDIFYEELDYVLDKFPKSVFLNHPLLPCGVEGFLLMNLLDNW
jgi:hypothetical protein